MRRSRKPLGLVRGLGGSNPPLSATFERSAGPAVLDRQGVSSLGIISWIVIGLIAGVIAKMVMRDRVGWIMTILVGMAGAVVGGWISTAFGGPGVSGINVTSIVVAALGAIAVFFVYGLIARRRW
jgi:uncharacterized membrane protein YeaQ/YmgE (transglycosylase-associated protein family)